VNRSERGRWRAVDWENGRVELPGWHAVPADTPHAMPEEGEPRRTALALTPFKLFAKKCREYRPGISDGEIDTLWAKRPPLFEQKLFAVIRVAEAAGYTEDEL